MSRTDTLKSILGDNCTPAVLNAIIAIDPMKKYLASDKGKLSRQRSNLKYHEKQDALNNADSVSLHINKSFHEEFIAAKPDLDSEAPRYVYKTGTELWKAYCASAHPGMTRSRYISFLPQDLRVVPTFYRDGKKQYSAAYCFNLLDYSEVI